MLVNACCYLIMMAVMYNVASNLDEAVSQIKNKKLIYKYWQEDFINNLFLLLLSIPLIIFVLLIIIINLKDLKKLIWLKNVKVVHNLGRNKRSIYGYKNKVWVCKGSGIDGEFPAEVIKRIKEKYRGHPLKQHYINAVIQVAA